MSDYDLLWAEARKLPADASDEALRVHAQAISDARAVAESPSIAPTFSRKAILFNQELAALKAELAAKVVPASAPAPTPEKAEK